MRIFVVLRDEAGVRNIAVVRSGDSNRLARLLENSVGQEGLEVARIVGADLKDVVLSHPALFEERAA